MKYLSTKKSLYDLTDEELLSFIREAKLPKFRAKQVEAWLLKGIIDPNEMNNIPKSLREMLINEFRIDTITCIEKLESNEDETVKYVFRLADGNVVEAVFMQYRYGSSVCISSQAGCNMGCTFCASATAGFGRNLSTAEMLGQVAYIGQDLDIRIDNVVVMGIGEPLENYDELVNFIHYINHPDGLNIGRRHITVSTCGIVPMMLKFADDLDQVNLAVSLHAPNDKIRRELMPIAKVYKIERLIAACKTYIQKTNRRITFEYILLSGVNDSVKMAEELAELLSGMNCLVNLIPANEYPGGEFKRSSNMQVQAFKTVLEERHITVTVRRELGKDILAACGQLRRRLEDE